MSKNEPAIGWKDAKRQAAQAAIVDAAWGLVRDEGLAGLAMRDLAKRAGISTPTVYAYFESKDAIYDAMFGRAATECVDFMTAPYESDDPRTVLTTGVHRFVEFCTSDVARYQLLFQRTIPGFEPTSESFAPAVRALEAAVERLNRAGVTDPRQIDMWTAWITGLVDQQISNDPGGDRWIRLIDDFISMFFAYTESNTPPVLRTKRKATATRSTTSRSTTTGASR
jgi:AcrR family transcriptional regulator